MNDLDIMLRDIIDYINTSGGKLHKSQVSDYLKSKYTVQNDTIINAVLDLIAHREEGLYPELKTLGVFFCTDLYFSEQQKRIFKNI